MTFEKTMLALIGATVTFLVPAPLLANTIGITAAVNRAATGTPPSGAVRTLTLGDNIIFNEKIKTDDVGLLQILLADGTSFTVGPNSDLTIDRFVYDPDTGKAKVAATLTKGVFRFIGARTSKTEGGVTLTSPVGTIGIRGAVADISINERKGHGGVLAHIDMIFGDELTLTGSDRKTQRVYEPGYSIVVRGDGQGARTAGVQKTPKDNNTLIQAALSGRPGTTGGSPNTPSNQNVEVSGIANQNSNLPPEINNPPVPTPRPAENVTETASNAVTEAQVRLPDGTLPAGEPSQPPSSQTTPPPPAPPPAPGLVRYQAHVLTAGATYDFYGGGQVVNPGLYGLIGGSPQTDQTVGLDSSGQGTALQGPLSLPVYNDSAFTQHVVLEADGYTFAGQPLSGRVYAGVEDFAFYTLAINQDFTNPVVVLTGTPITDLSSLQNGDIRRYSFTVDPLQNSVIPFNRANALPGSQAGAAVSDFYMIEGQGFLGMNALQASLLISGTGLAQVSEIGVNAAPAYTDNSGNLMLDFSRRGSLLGDATDVAHSFYGGISTLGGATGGSRFFGSNGQNLVLGQTVDINDTFGDSGFPHDFGSMHALNLESEQTAANFVASNGSTRVLGQQAPIRGFASGVERGFNYNSNQTYLFNTVSASPDDVQINFNGGNNTLGGELTVRTADTSLSVAFGQGIRGNTLYGGSAYIDDDTFGAANNGSKTRTNVTDYDNQGNVISLFLPIPSNNNHTYMVSGDMVPQTNILPGGQMCSCKFLEWGWWGTIITAATDPAAASPDIESTVHLGTWVAGDVTSNAQLSTLAGTTGSFQGKALGTVLDSSTGVAGTYIASGDMSMSFDFGTRTGSMSITNFDNRNFSGTLASQAGPDATFAGTLTGSNNAASGGVNGAFVNDGATIAKGVIGDFSLSDNSDWAAVGIVAGAR